MRRVSINSMRSRHQDKLAIKPATHCEVTIHVHDCLELAYVLEGHAEHILQGKVYPVQKGDFFIIDYNVAHGYCGSKDFQVLNCMFLPELIEDSLVGCTSFDQLLRVCLGRYHRQSLGSTPANRIFADTDGQVLALLQGIQREAEQPDLGSREILRGRLLEIMILITRKVVDRLENTVNTALSPPISQAVQYFETNFAQKAALQRFCEEYHYSAPYISGRFKAELGCTAVQYLQRLRVEKSCRMLASQTHSIKEIAAMVGYENEKFFQKLFHRLLDMSPREYRQRIRCSEKETAG